VFPMTVIEVFLMTVIEVFLMNVIEVFLMTVICSGKRVARQYAGGPGRSRRWWWRFSYYRLCSLTTECVLLL